MLAAILLSGIAVVAGCAPDPEPTPTTAAPVPTQTATPTAAPEPTLVPDGTATDNLPLFRGVVEQVWASDRRAEGRAYVDALVGAGFDKAAMQVTEDQSTVGNPAESILVSVRWGEECLIGQVGPETGEPVAAVERVVGEGMCLIGNTRPIDW